VADFEADVPEEADQLLELRGQQAVGLLRQQDQQIDVGRRVQLASTVAADCNQRERRRHGQFAPEFAEDFVDQAAALVQQSRGITLGEILLADHPLSILQAGLQGSSSPSAGWRNSIGAQEGHEGCRRQPVPGQPGPVPHAASHQQPGPGKQRGGGQALLFEQIEQDL
jgi:hypothetical protein